MHTHSQRKSKSKLTYMMSQTSQNKKIALQFTYTNNVTEHWISEWQEKNKAKRGTGWNVRKMERWESMWAGNQIAKIKVDKNWWTLKSMLLLISFKVFPSSLSATTLHHEPNILMAQSPCFCFPPLRCIFLFRNTCIPHFNQKVHRNISLLDSHLFASFALISFIAFFLFVVMIIYFISIFCSSFFSSEMAKSIEQKKWRVTTQ